MEFFITEQTEKKMVAILAEVRCKMIAEYTGNNLAARKKYGTFDIDKASGLEAMRRAYQLGCEDNY